MSMDNDSIRSSSSNEPSVTSSSRHTHTTDGSAERAAHYRANLFSKETKAVAYVKLSMILLLVAIVCASAAIVYKTTSKEEEDNFRDHFVEAGNRVFSVYAVNADIVVQVYKNFALQIATYAAGSNSTWPFVTISNFEALAQRALHQSESTSISVSHIVHPEQREEWEQFMMENSEAWLQESYDFLQDESDLPEIPTTMTALGDRTTLSAESGTTFLNGTIEGYDVHAPVWQVAPANTRNFFITVDLLSWYYYADTFDHILENNGPVLSDVINLNEPSDDKSTWPNSFIIAPIYKEVVQQPSIEDFIGTIQSTMPWHRYFTNLLPEGTSVFLVLENACDVQFGYLIDGPDVVYLGVGDPHNTKYTQFGVSTEFNPFSSEMDCPYTITVYPTAEFASTYETNNPVMFTAVVTIIFFFTILTFVVYDAVVEFRQRKVVATAEKSNALVSTLFPQRVVERLMENSGAGVNPVPKMPKVKKLDAETWQTTFQQNGDFSGSKPIAELFPSASVMFADIVGFTAWSSEREPSQVFELLEKIYASFDHIAKRRKVFKVETIGDCYMAATGLPERREDHAIVMARFARDCLRKMLHVVRKLEHSLGPSTGDLGMRVGIHSGPVTAGVLRGEKARFQLFGDTVNTAARMESTGASNKIHVSADTAAFIRAAEDEEISVVPREDAVQAKGKGVLSTFWLVYADSRSRSNSFASQSSRTDTDAKSQGSLDNVATEVHLEDTEQKKLDRSVIWTTDVLLNLLRQVVAMRGNTVGEAHSADNYVLKGAKRPLDEVVDIVDIVDLHSQQKLLNHTGPKSVKIPEAAANQLRSYVLEIASNYHANFFHNFEHATHVTMSVTKLLSRIVAPDLENSDDDRAKHEYTFGITSDPLAQFAVAFSALIHDVDHPGVPNVTLVKEKNAMADQYKNQSVAEQNSVDRAWQLLSEPEFADLRACIYSDETEFKRFRQLVVNSVMATDIADKELGAARKARWNLAFAENDSNKSGLTEDKLQDANRKATIVIEHLIQASDVAHTMQHWHVYTRWNERFFRECYVAYLDGRSDVDPATNWYKSELGFFDFYIIPLAKKLKDCQVFGVSSDEYLNYAEANRQEWEAKGEALVHTYLENFMNAQNGDFLG